MSTARIVVSLAALAGATAGAMVFAVPEEPESGTGSPKTASQPLPHSWPPVVGETYPSLDLTTLDGKPFDFDSLRGKVVLLEAVALTSPGSIGFAGIPSFGVARAQQDLTSTDDLLAQSGIDPDDEDLRFVQLLFYDTQATHPTPERARRWAADTRFGSRENTILLLGDARYLRPNTLRMVPGFQLLDRELVLRADGAGVQAPDNIYDVVFPRLARLLNGADTAAGVVAAPTPPPTLPANPDAQRLVELLVDADYDALESAYAEIRASGRAAFSYSDRASTALTILAKFPASLAHLDEWIRARPESAAARIVSGQRWIRFAWAARGNGFADSVDQRGWTLFAERLDNAERELREATRLDPQNPDAHARLITVAMGRNEDDAVARGHYERAIALDPTCMAAHSRYFTSILPRWSGGTYQSVAKFINRVRTTLDDDPAVDLFALRLHAAIARMTEAGTDYLRRDAVAQDVRRASKSLEISYPSEPEPWRLAGRIQWELGDKTRARESWLRAAELGDGSRALSHGHRLIRDGKTAQDNKEGFEWLVRSATFAYSEAFAFVGWSYVQGDGVAIDDDLARQWFEAGIVAEESRCMHGLGALLESGCGVPRDLRKSLYWFDRAGIEFDKGRAARDRLLREHPELAR